jgi:2-methylisocitrate lyase-like PEP mutase family enzyme
LDFPAKIAGVPPTAKNEDVPSAVAAFRALHESGCFVLPNPWDRGTAAFLHHLGYPALATTSAGFAFSRGLPDSMTALSVDAVLAHTREIVEATPLPVNADFQAGYADDTEGLAVNVDRCVRTGVAGLSIEDSTGDEAEPLFERSLAVERVRAARRAIDATGIPVVLTARCEAWLVGYPDAKSVVLDRLVAFAEAGADCLYAPGTSDPDTISMIVKAVAPRPVNVLMAAPDPALSVPVLAGLGVRRISVGSALARASWGAFIRASRGILQGGTFDALDTAASFDELNGIFSDLRQD